VFYIKALTVGLISDYYVFRVLQRFIVISITINLIESPGIHFYRRKIILIKSFEILIKRYNFCSFFYRKTK